MDSRESPKASDLPATAVARVAQARRCVGPYPCGRGAGAGDRDLPCDCEQALFRVMHFAVGPGDIVPWTGEEAEKTADIMFATLTAFEDGDGE